MRRVLTIEEFIRFRLGEEPDSDLKAKKLRVLDEHHAMCGVHGAATMWCSTEWCALGCNACDMFPCPLFLLAAVYESHPNYRVEWAIDSDSKYADPDDWERIAEEWHNDVS